MNHGVSSRTPVEMSVWSGQSWEAGEERGADRTVPFMDPTASPGYFYFSHCRNYMLRVCFSTQL